MSKFNYRLGHCSAQIPLIEFATIEFRSTNGRPILDPAGKFRLVAAAKVRPYSEVGSRHPNIKNLQLVIDLDNNRLMYQRKPFICYNGQEVIDAAKKFVMTSKEVLHESHNSG